MTEDFSLLHGAVNDLHTAGMSVWKDGRTAGYGTAQAVFISYAWGDLSKEGQRRMAAVERLSDRLEAEGIRAVLDRHALNKGDSICAFMKRFAKADHIIAFISEKYLQSASCMAELHYLWRNCNAEASQFSERIHPLILDDAKGCGTRKGRLAWAQHWQEEREVLQTAQRKLGANFGVEDQRELKLVTEFALHVSDILHWMNDILMPRGLDDILEDDFSSILLLLKSDRGTWNAVSSDPVRLESHHGEL